MWIVDEIAFQVAMVDIKALFKAELHLPSIGQRQCIRPSTRLM